MASARDFPKVISRGPLRGQRFGTQHAYLEALARAQQRGSRFGKRITPKSIKSTSALGKLSTREQENRARALDALSRMRNGDVSLRDAAKEAGTTPDTVKRYAGDALERRGGRYTAKPTDRLARRMIMIAAQPLGPIPLTVTDSRTASKIARHAAAVRHYLDTGDASGLRPFRNTYITVDKRSYRFLTDTKDIDRLARLGSLSFESLYVLVA